MMTAWEGQSATLHDHQAYPDLACRTLDPNTTFG